MLPGPVLCFSLVVVVVVGFGVDLCSILPIENKMIIIERIFFENVIKKVSYENQVLRALCGYVKTQIIQYMVWRLDESTI